MTCRYLALLARSSDSRAAWEVSLPATAVAASGLAPLIVGQRLALLAADHAIVRVGDFGAIVGKVFRRGETKPLAVIDPDTSRASAATGGAWLCRTHWGSYVSFTEDPNSGAMAILRAPFGELPCYLVESTYGVFAASDVALLEQCTGYVPRVDWAQVARQLARAHLHSRATCLGEVTELAGGTRLRMQSSASLVEDVWRPWDHIGGEKRISDREEAMRRVRDSVQLVVGAHSGLYRKILLKLSGGLDSSIVAAGLVRCGAQFGALTLVTRDPAGNEFAHAQAVADHLGVPIESACRDVSMVDLEESAAKGLPRPVARAFVQASDELVATHASAYSANAVFDGGGGDNVFCLLLSVSPAIDSLLEDKGWSHFLQTARSIGVAAGVSTFKVARRALIRRWTRGTAYRWPGDCSLLSEHGRTLAGDSPDHPWLRPPRDTLPGSAGHIALLAAAQSFTESRDPRAALPAISPLITQPVVEACLRVPSWLWTHEGHDRAIARSAFAPFLPEAITDRRDKGGPDSFMGELLEANFEMIRSMLIDGLLVDKGIVDRAAVETAMARRYGFKGTSYIRLLQLVDVEAWARSWH